MAKKEVTFKNSKNLTLAGTLWQVPSKAIVICAHGSGENRFARGMFEQIATTLQKENYNVLAFDFSGHGKSDDAILSLAQSVDDVKSAINFCKSEGFQEIALVGHSLGGYSCLKAFTPEIKTIVLLGALTGPVQWYWEKRLPDDLLGVLKRTGNVTAEIDDGLRKSVTIDGKLCDDIRAIDQKALLGNISCPVFILHGNADQDELDFYAISKEGLQWLPKDSQMKIVDGAGHAFIDYYDEVEKVVKVWLLKYFPLP